MARFLYVYGPVLLILLGSVLTLLGVVLLWYCPLRIR